MLTSFKHQEPAFYTRLFDDPEEGPFEVPPCCTKVGVIIKPVPGDTKLYFLQEIKSVCVSCSLLCGFFFVGNKVSAYHFKYEVTTSLKSIGRLKLSQDVTMNHVK